MIRKTIKDLSTELDPDLFCQISRGAVVNLSRVERVMRDRVKGIKIWVAGTAMTVSQAYQARFRQM